MSDSPEINIDRVSNRVNKGGHRVNLKKIISRYKQTLENLPYAIKYSSRVYLFDNSGKEIKLIAEIFEGNMQLKYFNPPNWFLYYVLPDFI